MIMSSRRPAPASAVLIVFALTLVASLPTPIAADPAAEDPDEGPPAGLLEGKPANRAALQAVFKRLTLERLSCMFREEKHIALLARPLRSTGTLVFTRDRGIARQTVTPRAQRVVLTPTVLRIYKGERVEEVPLSKSEDLKAFALIFPTLLRGDLVELESTFTIALYGRSRAWWGLTFTPSTESLRKMVRRVVVVGRAGLPVSLRVEEMSGDTTEITLSEVKQDDKVSDAEVAAAFEAP